MVGAAGAAERRFRRGGAALLSVALICVVVSACVLPPWLSWPGRNSLSRAVITSANTHSCALTSNGGVKCWGDNRLGAVGDGTTTDRWTPTDVAGLTHGVRAVTSGWSHSCALTDAGGVKCWGYNFNGQLGDGTRTNRLTPVDVVGLEHGVTGLSAGAFHTCALTTRGAAKCWGWNSDGQLGDGTTGFRLTPVDVVGLGSGVRSVTGADSHSCAITAAGAARCWGLNDHGQLGDGTTQSRLTPVDVAGLASGVTSISAGTAGFTDVAYSFTCAVVRSGVKCWGSNAYGQLGDGTTTDHLTPVDVIGAASGVAIAGAGGGFVCLLRNSGGVACWGVNYAGQLGDGTTTTRSVPTQVVGLASGVTDIAPGGYQTCVLTRSGGVKCWGGNGYGQVGNGQNQNTTMPVDVSGSFYRRECPTLVPAPHTDFVLTNGYGRGSVATFTAAPGYALNGTVTLRCGADTTWDGTPPSTVTTGHVTVTPNSGLTDGQTVDVTMTGFAPGAPLAWCQAVVAPVPAGSGLCGGPIRTATADATGSAQDLSYPLARIVYVPALGRTVDCANSAEHCVLGAADVRDVGASVTSADLAFAPAP